MAKAAVQGATVAEKLAEAALAAQPGATMRDTY